MCLLSILLLKISTEIPKISNEILKALKCYFSIRDEKNINLIQVHQFKSTSAQEMAEGTFFYHLFMLTADITKDRVLCQNSPELKLRLKWRNNIMWKFNIFTPLES